MLWVCASVIAADISPKGMTSQDKVGNTILFSPSFKIIREILYRLKWDWIEPIIVVRAGTPTHAYDVNENHAVVFGKMRQDFVKKCS